jgi:hypothetical protein
MATQGAPLRSCQHDVGARRQETMGRHRLGCQGTMRCSVEVEEEPQAAVRAPRRAWSFIWVSSNSLLGLESGMMPAPA